MTRTVALYHLNQSQLNLGSRNAATTHLVRHQTVGRTLLEETPLLIEKTPLLIEETPLMTEETPLQTEEIPLIAIEETPLIKNPQWIS